MCPLNEETGCCLITKGKERGLVCPLNGETWFRVSVNKQYGIPRRNKVLRPQAPRGTSCHKLLKALPWGTPMPNLAEIHAVILAKNYTKPFEMWAITAMLNFKLNQKIKTFCQLLLLVISTKFQQNRKVEHKTKFKLIFFYKDGHHSGIHFSISSWWPSWISDWPKKLNH